MKFLKNITIILLIGMIVFVSCKEDKEDYGPFTLSKVTSVLNHDSVITKTNLSSFILLHGGGFTNISKILINDIEVDLDETYISPNLISIKVPRKLPATIDNKVKVVRGNEQVDADLEVGIPPFRVDGMYNEFTLPDSTMTIVGDFFDLYDVDKENGKVLFGTQELPITEAAWTYIRFKVPTNATPGTKITLKSSKTNTPVPGKYREAGMMLINGESLGWIGPVYGSVVDADTPCSRINGSYLRMTYAKDFAGWGEAYAGGGHKYTDDMKANPQNYVMKFEISTLIPMVASNRKIVISFGGVEYHDWGAFEAGGTIDTGKKWRTISVNLKKVFSDAEGNLKLPGTENIQIWAWPHWVTATEDYDICFDNLRIVRVN